jgi:hypothetical protein
MKSITHLGQEEEDQARRRYNVTVHCRTETKQSFALLGDDDEEEGKGTHAYS